MEALITDIERFSLTDGPGIRTLVFFAGCGMRCRWCQNPETLNKQKQLMFDAGKCSGCGACLMECEYGAIYRNDEGLYVTDREKCQKCFSCVEVCYNEARKLSSYTITLDELMAEVLKDRVFYETSGGGVTLSGGEALLQTEFCRAFAQRLHGEGIHVAVETAGHYPHDTLLRVVDEIDLFLYDMKFIDAGKQKQYTGVDNKWILQNFDYVAKHKNIIVRIPLIPGVNDGDEFDGIIDHITQYPAIDEIHILPFHNLGDSKYDQLDMEYGMRDKQVENARELERCAEYARTKGLRVSEGGAGF